MLLFVDEIHRWNKAQQDALLPHLESGKITLIGATTENPAFHLIPALRSRTEVLVLRRIEESDLVHLLRRALVDPCGLGISTDDVEDGLFEAIARASDGDARRALGLLERLADRGPLRLDALAHQGVTLHHDRDGDAHYDVVSALIKSMRGSDPDAAIYWLARMLEGGEDPLYVARRLVIFASEDIGNADPRALELAVAALQGVTRIGMPEARLLLGQTVLYLASAPKSNACYLAIQESTSEVHRTGALPVPPHLRSSPPLPPLESNATAKPYKNPHEFPDRITRQKYLPAPLTGVRYYRPTEVGAERIVRERLAWWEHRLRERGE